jgi:hypothetical protein
MAELSIMNSQGFPYGINWSRPPESIADTELVQAENCEYDEADGSLKTVQGITAKIDMGTSVDTLFYDNRNACYYFTCGAYIYKTVDMIAYAKLGQITGTRKPVFTMYGGVCLIASGGQLQSITGGNTVSTIQDSPTRCDFVTVRSGRVLVYAGDSDALRYSAIGDHTSWKQVASDSSSGQSINVGYKDPGNIIAVDFLSKAIMVYKEGGRAYKIVGEPQDSDYAVEPVSQTAYCGSQRATVSVDSKSYYLGMAGMMSFQPTSAYGDVQPFEEGLNVNAWIASNIDENCEMWRLPNKKQIWLKTQNDNRIYIYHYIPRYQDSRGAFTVRTMSHTLNDVCCVGPRVYVAYGNKIGVLDSSVDTDDGVQIQTAITSGTKIASKHSILVMSRLFVSQNIIEGVGTIKCGKKVRNLSFDTGSTYAYDATGYAYDATEYAYQDPYTRSYKVGGGNNKSVNVEILVQNGAISLREMHYEYLEV